MLRSVPSMPVTSAPARAERATAAAYVEDSKRAQGLRAARGRRDAIDDPFPAQRVEKMEGPKRTVFLPPAIGETGVESDLFRVHAGEVTRCHGLAPVGAGWQLGQK